MGRRGSRPATLPLPHGSYRNDKFEKIESIASIIS